MHDWSYLQQSSSLEELQGLLYGVVQAVVAPPGQVGSDQTHGDHQPPAHSRGDIWTTAEVFSEGEKKT